MTTQHEREDWEKEFDERFDWIDEYIKESYEDDSQTYSTSYNDIKFAIKDILKSHNDKLVAEIEKMKVKLKHKECDEGDCEMCEDCLGRMTRNVTLHQVISKLTKKNVYESTKTNNSTTV